MAILGVACDGNDRPAVESVSGVVVAVEAASIIDLDTLSVRDMEGEVWRFEAKEYTGLTPSHLREHMLQGLNVKVRFYRDNGAMVIEEVTD